VKNWRNIFLDFEGQSVLKAFKEKTRGETPQSGTGGGLNKRWIPEKNPR